MKRTYCDICGKELTGRYHDGVFSDAGEKDNSIDLQFCDECYCALTSSEPISADYLKEARDDAVEEPRASAKNEPAMAEQEISETEADKSEEKPAGAVDRGKVKALYKAGWKVPDIADDCHCSKATVYNILRDLRKERFNDAD